MNILPNPYLAAVSASTSSASAQSASVPSPTSANISTTSAALQLLKMHQDGGGGGGGGGGISSSSPSSSSFTSAITTTTPAASSSNHRPAPPTRSRSPSIITATPYTFHKDMDPSLPQCSTCDEPLDLQSNPPNYQMLAVRPSIGTPPGTPFFPFFEELNPEAVRMPCCHRCATSLLRQWAEHEEAHVPINRRKYVLRPARLDQPASETAPRYNRRNPAAAARGKNSIQNQQQLLQQQFEQQQQQFQHSDSTGSSARSSPLCLVAPQNPTQMLLLRQVVNGTSSPPAVPLDATVQLTATSSENSNSQNDEVLDLSMPTAPITATTRASCISPPPPSLSPQNLSRTNSASSSGGGIGPKVVASVLPFAGTGTGTAATVPTAASRLAQSSSTTVHHQHSILSAQQQTSQANQLIGPTQTQAQQRTTTAATVPSSLLDSVSAGAVVSSPNAALLPQYAHFNSSMTNLIKVTSNPAVVASAVVAGKQVIPSPSSSLTALQSVDSDHPPHLNHHPQLHNNSSTTGSGSKVKTTTTVPPLFLCSLCEETCTQLVPVALRPQTTASSSLHQLQPYFPTLLTYVKTPQIDSSGRISKCQ